MATKQRKEYVYSMTEQQEKTKIWHNQIKSWIADPIINEKYSTIIDDVNNFIVEEFYKARNCNAVLQLSENSIDMVWNEPGFMLHICFLGESKWTYRFEKKCDADPDFGDVILSTSQSGEGMFFESKGRKVQCLQLDNYALQAISIKDEYMYDYSPMLKHDKYVYGFENYVKLEWITSKYDGILAGYCTVNGKFCIFDMAEETEFDRNRIYAVYELSKYEEIKAKLHHSFIHYLFKTPLKKFYWKYSKFKSNYEHKTNMKKYGKDYIRVGVKKYHDYLATLPLIGYFEFS